MAAVMGSDLPVVKLRKQHAAHAPHSAGYFTGGVQSISAPLTADIRATDGIRVS